MAAAAAAASTLSYLQAVPQSFMGLQFILMAGALIAVRASMRLRYARRSRRRTIGTAFIDAREDILVVGVNAITGLFLRCVAESGETRIAVAGILSESHRHRGRLFGSHPILGGPEDIVQIMHELDIHGIHVNRVVLTKSFDSLPETAQRALLRAEHELSIRIEVLDERFGLGEAATAQNLRHLEHRTPLRATRSRQISRRNGLTFAGSESSTSRQLQSARFASHH
jgi:FlaA1/EpsC-like NDP-sugar epimerase